MSFRLQQLHVKMTVMQGFQAIPASDADSSDDPPLGPLEQAARGFHAGIRQGQRPQISRKQI